MGEMLTVDVPLEHTGYCVWIGDGLLSHVGEKIRPFRPMGRVAVITDSNVGSIYGDAVLKSLCESGYDADLIEVPAGESSKSLQVVGDVCDRMIRAGFDRKALVVALGGGVVGDLAGFVAGIYYRGVPYVQVPTTVVAQVDSSVGGKTGVNAPGGKNLIGVFHQPLVVIADTSTLATLPEREFNEGFAEIIKHAAICDPEMLGALDGPRPELMARNVAIKARIVAADERETTGERALLNFGHTVGHAIEQTAGYGRYLHGEAISIGLHAAARLSVRKAGLAAEDCGRIVAALEEYRLPLTIPGDLSTDALLEAIQRDKKFEAGGVRFVLIDRLGSAFVSSAVTVDDIRSVIDELR